MDTTILSPKYRICWSAKIRPTREAVPDIYHEYRTTTLLEKYCPYIPRPFDGLDEMLLLSWVLKKLEGTEEQPFVLHYWDLRPPNIILDGNDDSVG